MKVNNKKKTHVFQSLTVIIIGMYFYFIGFFSKAIVDRDIQSFVGISSIGLLALGLLLMFKILVRWFKTRME